MSSEKKVQKERELLIHDYIIPFDKDLDKEKIVNLSSDATFDNTVAEILLHVYDIEIFKQNFSE